MSMTQSSTFYCVCQWATNLTILSIRYDKEKQKNSSNCYLNALLESVSNQMLILLTFGSYNGFWLNFLAFKSNISQISVTIE